MQGFTHINNFGYTGFYNKIKTIFDNGAGRVKVTITENRQTVSGQKT